MKYSLRLIWYIVGIIAIALTVFALAIVAFFVAKDTGNVYVIVTEGMKERAAVILDNGDPSELNAYFSADYIARDNFLRTTAYDSVKVKDYTYHLKVKSIWCYPWAGKAKVVLEESIPDISVAPVTVYDDEGGQRVYTPEYPVYPRGIYELQLQNIDSKWLIVDVVQNEALPPEPAPTPDPGQNESPESSEAPVLTPAATAFRTVPPANN